MSLIKSKPAVITCMLMSMASATVYGQTLSDAAHLPGATLGSVAISGDTAIVEDTYAEVTSTFNIYKQDDQLNWSLQDQITNMDRTYHGGGVLALDNNIAAIGYFGRNNLSSDTGYTETVEGGEVLVYSANTSGIWELQATLRQEETWQRFGRSIAVSGNTIAVGSAPFYREKSSIYIFEKGIGSDWNLQTKLPIEFANLNRLNTYHSDYEDYRDLGCCHFKGSVLSLSNDYLIALLSGVDDGFDITNAVILERNDNNEWTEQAILPADNFSNVAIHGNTAVISSEGKITFYERSESDGWTLDSEFTESATNFGIDVTLSDDHALITADKKIYHYKRTQNGEWQANGITSAMNLGATAVSGATALVSASTNLASGGFVIDLSLANNETAACIDTDPMGDGWGWNGTESCQTASPIDACIYDHAVSNFGWGWNPATRQSCPPPSDASCIDTDGDGWGWDGMQSCRVE